MECYLLIPVYFHTESTKLLQSCNIKINPDNYIIRDMAFFNFDLIMPVFEDEREYCQIELSGNKYFSPLTMEEVLDMVDEMFGEEIGLNEN